MPLLYGEGRKSFMRLQFEIMKISDDESLFAWVNDGLWHYSSGLLANSPLAFRASGDIEVAFTTRSTPYVMTNKGLQITLMLCKIGGNLPYSPLPQSKSVYYLTPLNCHSKISKLPVVLKLLATVGDFVTERYVRIEPYKMDFNLLQSEISTRFEQQIFVSQPESDHVIVPGYPRNICVEVHAGCLLDREFSISTGSRSIFPWGTSYGQEIFAREWKLGLNYTQRAQSIEFQSSTATFILDITFSFSLFAEPQYLSIDLSLPRQYADLPLSERSGASEPGFGVLPVAGFPRRDRATLLLPCGDIVTASLKKTLRETEKVYTLDFGYVCQDHSA